MASTPVFTSSSGLVPLEDVPLKEAALCLSERCQSKDRRGLPRGSPYGRKPLPESGRDDRNSDRGGPGEHQLAKELVIESLHRESLPREAQRLVQSLAQYEHLLVALSGGVDSSLVAAAAARALPRRLVAVTADSPSVPRWQLQLAKQIADELGIEHQIIATDETDLPEYQRNDMRRCFYCKRTLYRRVQSWAESRFGSSAENVRIASGTNADDLGDYRPGIEAGRNSGVLTPLADLGFGKDTVRQLARYFGLSNHDLPAAPCLASRIAYGTEVTPERLRLVEQAEALLRELGFTQVRVRLHPGDLARIEVTRDEIPRLCELEREQKLSRSLRTIGFSFVTVDLEGFQSGSLNRSLVSIDLPSKSRSNVDPLNVGPTNDARSKEALS